MVTKRKSSAKNKRVMIELKIKTALITEEEAIEVKAICDVTYNGKKDCRISIING